MSVEREMSALTRMSWLRRALAGALVLYVVAWFFLTPLGGLETRSPSHVRPVGFATLGLLIVGVGLAVVSLVLILRGSRRPLRIAALSGVLYYPVFLTDQFGIFADHRPPTAIFWLEWFAAIIAAVIIVLAFWSGRTSPD
jgi:hypothetical protein